MLKIISAMSVMERNKYLPPKFSTIFNKLS